MAKKKISESFPWEVQAVKNFATKHGLQFESDTELPDSEDGKIMPGCAWTGGPYHDVKAWIDRKGVIRVIMGEEEREIDIDGLGELAGPLE